MTPLILSTKNGVFWVNIAKSELNLRYRYCFNLIGELRKEKEFRQQCCRNSTKAGERKKRNFGNAVTEIPLPKFLSGPV